MVTQIGEFISIGSTMNRELNYTARVHCMSPIIIASDSVHKRKMANWIAMTNDINGYHVCNGMCTAQRTKRYLIRII